MYAYVFVKRLCDYGTFETIISSQTFMHERTSIIETLLLALFQHLHLLLCGSVVCIQHSLQIITHWDFILNHPLISNNRFILNKIMSKLFATFMVCKKPTLLLLAFRVIDYFSVISFIYLFINIFVMFFSRLGKRCPEHSHN